MDGHINTRTPALSLLLALQFASVSSGVSIVPAAVINRLRELYEGRGACFVVLPNLGKYPRSDFFDTSYHLQETFQIAHSTALAPILAEISRISLCPEAAR